jgi:hypothetical protein
MLKVSKSKKARGASRKGRKAACVPNPGLPDKETVVSERAFVSPKGNRYRIIRTTEKDPYDPPDDEKKGGSS